jgi:hypothetical protein
VRAGKVCCWESIPRFPVCRKYRTNFHTWAKLSICSIFCTSNKKSNLIHTVLGTARAPIFFYKGSGEKFIWQFFERFFKMNLKRICELFWRIIFVNKLLMMNFLYVQNLSFVRLPTYMPIDLSSQYQSICLFILLSTHHECPHC